MKRILYKAVQQGDRVPVVSREEWESIFSEYQPSDRYFVANLAAHNWDVFQEDDVIVVCSPWSGGYRISKSGERSDLSIDEFETLYPRRPLDSEEQYPKFTRSWIGNVYRQKEIVFET